MQEQSQFSRSVMLLGKDAQQMLQQKHVAIFGLGGVGSYTVEALARAGVGTLTLVDHDVIARSNLNRQLYALHSTLQQQKAEVARSRVMDINPGCKVRALPLFYSADTAADIFTTDCDFDYIVDAIDTVSAKLDLAVQAQNRKIPMISCMGTGNKLDATQFQITDIKQTRVCPLCRVMRRELPKRGVPSLRVLWSAEQPRKPQLEAPMPRGTPGSVSFVPPVAGMLLAGEVIRNLIDAH